RCTTGGLMHGAALMGLADTLGGVCAFLNLPEGAGTSTIESKTNFFRGVREGAANAVTRPLHGGRTTIVVQTAITDDQRRRVANIVPIGRNPMLLAKELAQLDQLAGGRLLISIVSGLDQPGERQALGLGAQNRGGYLDEVIPLLRVWWAGEVVDHHSERFDFPNIAVHPRPRQDPLEIWLGGSGPVALGRIGRLGD